MPEPQLNRVNMQSDVLNTIFNNAQAMGQSTYYLIPKNFKQHADTTQQCGDYLAIYAALCGLDYPVEQLILRHCTAQNTEDSLQQAQHFFMVKNPENSQHGHAQHFQQNIEKICQHFQIQSSCRIEIVQPKAHIQVLHQGQTTHHSTEVQQVTACLDQIFWPKFTQTTQALKLEVANEFEAVSEPQTNLGRLARQLKIMDVLATLNLSKTSA